MISRTPSALGQPRAEIACDECGESAIIPCPHDKKSRGVNEGQAIKKAQEMGWSYVRKTLRCPSCETKRKAPEMVQRKSTKAPPKASPETGIRQPSLPEKRQIMDLLTEVYDIDQGRYRRNDTDDTVADVLGVMPAWVAAIRDEWFGPSGSNTDIEDLEIKITAWLSNAESQFAFASEIAGNLKAMIEEGKSALGEIDRVKSALSDRVKKKAGVQ